MLGSCLHGITFSVEKYRLFVTLRVVRRFFVTTRARVFGRGSGRHSRRSWLFWASRWRPWSWLGLGHCRARRWRVSPIKMQCPWPFKNSTQFTSIFFVAKCFERCRGSRRQRGSCRWRERNWRCRQAAGRDWWWRWPWTPCSFWPDPWARNQTRTPAWTRTARVWGRAAGRPSRDFWRTLDDPRFCWPDRFWRRRPLWPSHQRPGIPPIRPRGWLKKKSVLGLRKTEYFRTSTREKASGSDHCYFNCWK